MLEHRTNSCLLIPFNQPCITKGMEKETSAFCTDFQQQSCQSGEEGLGWSVLSILGGLSFFLKLSPRQLARQSSTTQSTRRDSGLTWTDSLARRPHEDPSPSQTPHSSRVPEVQQRPAASRMVVQQVFWKSTNLAAPPHWPQASIKPELQQRPVSVRTAPVPQQTPSAPTTPEVQHAPLPSRIPVHVIYGMQGAGGGGGFVSGQ